MLNLNSIFPCLYYKVATPNHIQYILYFQESFSYKHLLLIKGNLVVLRSGRVQPAPRETICHGSFEGPLPIRDAVFLYFIPQNLYPWVMLS